MFSVLNVTGFSGLQFYRAVGELIAMPGTPSNPFSEEVPPNDRANLEETVPEGMESPYAFGRRLRVMVGGGEAAIGHITYHNRRVYFCRCGDRVATFVPT